MDAERSSIGARRRRLPATEELVTGEPLAPGRTLPFAFRPTCPDVDLVSWALGARDSLRRQLHECGALLFRGFPGVDRDMFARFTSAASGDAMPYVQRSSPRREIGNNIYTSTEQPADQIIFLHNEHSYSLNWPMRLFFFCEVAPAADGATPLADARRVYERVSPRTRDAFANRGGYAYVRHCRRGIGLHWTEIYQTEDRAEVEEYCRANDIEATWHDDDSLTTRQVRPMVRIHPTTGEPVWFNHMLFFNEAILGADIRAPLMAGTDLAHLPNNTYYGDGGLIEPEHIQEVRAAYDAEQISFPWKEGDILLIDNMLVSHGRERFTPPRCILVAMTEPHDTFVA